MWPSNVALPQLLILNAPHHECCGWLTTWLQKWSEFTWPINDKIRGIPSLQNFQLTESWILQEAKLGKPKITKIYGSEHCWTFNPFAWIADTKCTTSEVIRPPVIYPILPKNAPEWLCFALDWSWASINTGEECVSTKRRLTLFTWCNNLSAYIFKSSRRPLKPTHSTRNKLDSGY